MRTPRPYTSRQFLEVPMPWLQGWAREVASTYGAPTPNLQDLSAIISFLLWAQASKGWRWQKEVIG